MQAKSFVNQYLGNYQNLRSCIETPIPAIRLWVYPFARFPVHCLYVYVFAFLEFVLARLNNLITRVKLFL